MSARRFLSLLLSVVLSAVGCGGAASVSVSAVDIGGEYVLAPFTDAGDAPSVLIFKADGNVIELRCDVKRGRVSKTESKWQLADVSGQHEVVAGARRFSVAGTRPRLSLRSRSDPGFHYDKVR